MPVYTRPLVPEGIKFIQYFVREEFLSLREMRGLQNYFAILFLLLAGLNLHGQLTFIVNDVPANTPDSSIIFLAGNFNGWQPGLTTYQLEEDSLGRYLITFNPNPGTLEFKFTRGSWETVEGNLTGGFRPNRTYAYAGGLDTAFFQILGWEDLGGNSSTAAENVHILQDAFHLPTLNRNRRIWIYLPPDYETTDKRYKVLYMHDGQNLFDVTTSFAGEWEIDETLNRLFDAGDEGCIVVGIDNGGTHRLDEYSPWINPEYGGGEGDAYLIDLISAVKPHIDANYRTLPGREHTGIMGSSMGGLISMYGGMKYDTIFSRIGIFSCSYWFAREAAFDFADTDPHELPMRIYGIAGAQEGGNIPADAIAMDATLQAKGYTADELSTTIHQDGSHAEWYWARVFEDAYRWLWDPVTPTKEIATDIPLSLFPNPASDSVRISYEGKDRIETIRILDLQGILYRQFNGNPGRFDAGELPKSCIVHVLFESGRTLAKPLLINN